MTILSRVSFLKNCIYARTIMYLFDLKATWDSYVHYPDCCGFKGIYICHDLSNYTFFKLYVFIAYQWNLKNNLCCKRYVFKIKISIVRLYFKVCHLFFISFKILCTVCLLLSHYPRHIYFKKDRWNHGTHVPAGSLDIGP